VSARELAQSFGNVAELYDRVRLEYSRAPLDYAVSALGLDPASSVLDLAAGTGKLTRALAWRFDTVVAVEPDDAMRSLIRGVEAYAGTAEEIPLPAASFDAVFVGEAFHWFDGPAALREIARVLRPHGALVLIWNNWWEKEEPRMPAKALELLAVPYERTGRAAMVAEKDWRSDFEGSPFGPLVEQALVPEPIDLESGELVDLYLTTSSIALMEEGERDELAASLRGLMRGRYRLTVDVFVAWARLSP
jgi:SAM-dependent methyltransferase